MSGLFLFLDGSIGPRRELLRRFTLGAVVVHDVALMLQWPGFLLFEVWKFRHNCLAFI